ncbi:MAG: NAD-dependent epimerase/dehydratase family protein [Gemmatimonadota bacterium]|jgi:nucleoside-diphosphate-sugar epimerase|nr:NAD-dependent epimerase/dehydratase family protein [Gemmatimonadota bacterium]MDP6802501.1 NAD-dependent epimerase/dehydratase family protein [Gemmatimonadota bacterium]MDP7030942.1 NAD-dependent epimerase/dehydratase family protein [Gemmatimonadota bacterium]
MRRSAILITGANGEIGHDLIGRLSRAGSPGIVGLDLNPLDPELARHCSDTVQGSVLDRALLDRLVSEYEFTAVFHLAAMLSTRAEYTPVAAHDVNVQGTLNLLDLAARQAESSGRRVKFMFPSSIAVYGLPDLESKDTTGRIREKTWNLPTTMYGCNKVYCEQLGRYFASHYRQLETTRDVRGVDFRAIRFPGLISAVTVPSGGTSDFIPEMIHAAADGVPYECFVREDTRIPFMTMPDAVRALLLLEKAPEEALSWRVYNVTSFNPSAGEFRETVRTHWPSAEISFVPDARRQAIVDTWPADVNDDDARSEWGWAPEFDLGSAMHDYLVPGIAGERPEGAA